MYKGGALVTVTGLTIEQLQSIIAEGVRAQFDEFTKNLQAKEPEEYLSRAEVATMLKVHITTVHNQTKSGKLTPYKLGGRRVYYKRSELESAIIKLKK